MITVKWTKLERWNGMASADDRRLEVLRAIVADFVATKEPIGSKSLSMHARRWRGEAFGRAM